MEYIPITNTDVPFKFNITLDNLSCDIHFGYNATYDFFTADLYISGKLIMQGEKIVYGKPLFTMKKTALTSQMIPIDISGVEHNITFDNFGKAVLLYVLKEGEKIE